LTKTCFMHGFPLLPEHSSVLLSRLELMDFWILHGERFAIPVKVYYLGSCPLNFLFALFLHLLFSLLLLFPWAVIHNLANKYREEFKLPNLKLPFNNRQGFYFSIPQKDVQGKLPSKFIQVGNVILLLRIIEKISLLINFDMYFFYT